MFNLLKEKLGIDKQDSAKKNAASSTSAQHSGTTSAEAAARRDLRFKVVVLGGTGVGKTSLVFKYTKNIFTTTYTPTIVFDKYTHACLDVRMRTKRSASGEPNRVLLELWDIAHVELNGYHRDRLLEGAQGVLIVTDHSPHSDKAVDGWRAALPSFLSGEQTPIWLVCNKKDLGDPPSTEVLDAYCKASNIRRWVSTSAATGEGVRDLFDGLLEDMLSSHGGMRAQRDRGDSSAEGLGADALLGEAPIGDLPLL